MRVTQWKITDGQNEIKKILNMKLRHVGITIIEQQLEFHYFLILQVLNFAILNIACFLFRKKPVILKKLSENNVPNLSIYSSGVSKVELACVRKKKSCGNPSRRRVFLQLLGVPNFLRVFPQLNWKIRKASFIIFS